MEQKPTIQHRSTRKVKIGSIVIGADNPIAIQSMCATRTQNIDATVQQIEMLKRSGADLIRLAVDSNKDVDALREIRSQTNANIVIDLQENYLLIKDVAPFVQKVRYNPGHMHHLRTSIPVKEKVRFIVEVAQDYDLALRIGVNFGSLDPKNNGGKDPLKIALVSTYEHCDYVEELGFERYVVSLKSSDPMAVVKINEEFARSRPLIPIHLGVTEAGMLPDAEIKSRMAFEKLLAKGIGDTLRVSITIADSQKDQEVIIGKQIVNDVIAGRFTDCEDFLNQKLNVISCPSCSRVENSAFVNLAERVKKALEFAKNYKLTIAVMGCRVNGPGETDHADLGLWCAPSYVNLKKGSELIGRYSETEVIDKLVNEVQNLITKTAK